ncbi:hypothetical protein BDN70DRAFT_906883 [Pholiota conissans]|uniref:Origin recognition complex subunit 4 n=1 Tax=Pholiota conissans TaxID=109636 RepID=A0A9P6CZY7_9AGAR|nr:hypothetical protein BDN70DRAFT_906883 [Pholiota conissans]
MKFDASTNLSGPLPDYLLPCFNAYKHEILKTLHSPSVASSQTESPSINDIAAKQLTDLVDGTVLRAEGNSCLLLGPRGSGKSQMIDACIEKVAFKRPIVLRLSGWVQTTDRHALREIAFQLLQQTGTALLPDTEMHAEAEIDEENPFLEVADHLSGESNLTLPPSHLHALIPILLTLSRPVIVVLDAFDLFALHPRQSLLYCLLDTVQNCRASSENRGIAVVGITSRVDSVQLLEKRVKSRFSGRTIRTAPPGSLQESLAMAKIIMQPSGVCEGDTHKEEWKQWWNEGVQKFLEDNEVATILNETFGLSRDFKIMIRMLTRCVTQLTPNQPNLSLKAVIASAEIQRSRPRRKHLDNLPYPALCLLIASAHADTGGHKSFTFEMLYETYKDQVRALVSAPVQFNGGSIGMMRCPREVLISTFEDLVAVKIFTCTMASPSIIAKQFIKYRCAVDRHDIKGIVEKAGSTNLKKWLNKSQ